MRKYLTKLLIKWFGDEDELLLFVVKDLFNGLTAGDILSLFPDGSVRYKNKKLDNEHLIELQESADKFKGSPIWKFLTDDAKWQSQKNLHGSPDWNGVMFGRAMLHCIDTIEERLAQLSELKIK